MTQNENANPYAPPDSVDQVVLGRLSTLQSTLLILVALILLARAFTIGQWAPLLFAGLGLTSFFYVAALTKDALYALSALAGSLLMFRHPVGWWAAIAHWLWYLASDVIIVLLAELFGWQFPVRFGTTAVLIRSGVMMVVIALVISFLLWKPIRSSCRIDSDSLRRPLMMIASGALILALAINWVSGLR